MTTVQTIALAKLSVSKLNARALSPADVEGLAASIASLGLLQPLSVYAEGDGFKVEDGARRFAALHLLRSSKKLPPALRDGVPVIVQASPDLARVRSVAANEVREPMSNADTILAYRAMIRDGHTAETIAKACNVGEARVKRLLRLINVHDDILSAFKAGEVDMDAVAAFALTDDQGAQLAIFEDLRASGVRAYQVRQRLKSDVLPGHSDLAKFVGVEAYEAAGGRRLLDLFSEGDQDAGWLDGALAHRLADEKLALEVEKLKAEGWAQVVVGLPHEFEERLYRLQPGPLEMTQDEEDAVLGAEDLIESGEGTDEERAAAEKLLADHDAKVNSWPDEVKAGALAFIAIGRGGEVQIERGFQRAATVENKTASPAKPAASGDPALDGWGHGGHSDLTAIATASVRCALLAQPDTAQDILLAHLAVQAVHHRSETAIRLTPEGAHPLKGERLDGAEDLFDAVRDKWRGRLPETLEAAIPVVGALKAKEKAELAALCLGQSLDATEGGLHSYQRHPPRWASLGVIARAIGHKIADHWTPGADWLAKGSKPALLAGLKACGVSRFTPDHKKADMAAALAREAKANGWVPKLLADLTQDADDQGQVEGDAARMAAE